MKISFFTMEQFHGKSGIGSTRLRVHNLIKYWPEAGLYQYGEFPDVMIYQKVYIQADWQFIKHFENTQILDICDPDWLEHQSITETARAVDGITCPTQALADFIGQLTDKPIKVIPDRHDTAEFPPPKAHQGELKTAVWFGYQQNSDLIKPVVSSLEKRGISLTVISNENPYLHINETDYVPFIKYDQDTIYEELQKFDIAVLPKGNRPQDRFKSNNKTTMAQLLGLPVVTDGDELEAMRSAEARNRVSQVLFNEAKKNYDVKKSISEMKDFINVLQTNRIN